MKKFISISLSSLLLGASSLFATDLTEGWNLVAACEDIEVTSLDLTNITEIQSTGAILFNTEYALDGSGETMEAGIGYWINAATDTSIELGSTGSQPSIDLNEGWNLVGACVSADVTALNLTDISEIQDTSSILYNLDYGLDGSDASVEAGNGYWVKASTSTTSDSIFGSSEVVDSGEIPPMPSETDADFPVFP